MRNVLIPHNFEARGFAVAIDHHAPDRARIDFDVDGRQRYSFSLSRRQLVRLTAALERELEAMPSIAKRTRRISRTG
jgi:hypothetical protein